TLLHDILPFAYVVHTHPALVNGITCAQNGKAAVAELFGGGSLWIPSTNPGYVLSTVVKDAMDGYRAEKGRAPDLIFLQNHGVFVGADTTGGIRALYDRIMNTIGGKVKRRPDLGGELASFGNSGTVGREVLAALAGLGRVDWYIKFAWNPELARFTASEAAFKGVSRAFSPDHIVYAGSDPLFIDANTAESANTIGEALKKHADKTGGIPKTVAVQGLGVFGLGNSEKAAANALRLFNDEVKVSVYTESFGGPLFLSPEQTAFINNWEVERYRSKVAQ
ncbi:MAG: class II aldolase/adducin family protein, partial [Treponema sp.]|nr:class II aldolase/adducin family protein [Treponema sp.]